jgi:hypothetical protein
VFNIAPPRSVRHMYGTWLNQFGGKLKRQVLVAIGFLLDNLARIGFGLRL